MLHSGWQPDPDELAEGRAALNTVDGVTRAWRNRLTCGRVQLRLGQDGLWYGLARSGTGWDLTTAPDADPAAAFARAGGMAHR